MKTIPTTMTLAVVAALFVCGCSSPQQPAVAQWDAAAASEARAAVEKMAQLFAAMDLDGIKKGLAEDGTVASFELDLENKPVRLGSRDEAIKYCEEMFAALKKMGATLKVDVKSIDCRASSTLAYCAMEHDISVMLPDGKSMAQPSRASVVLRKGADGWKWTHWHTSLSATAPPAAT